MQASLSNTGGGGQELITIYNDLTLNFTSDQIRLK